MTTNRASGIVTKPLVVLVVVTGILVAAFVLRFVYDPQRFIDGYPVAEVASCGDVCGQYTTEAAAWLDVDAPGHASVVSTTFYHPDFREAGRHVLLATRSGDRGDYIVVMALADGAVRAVFVTCGVGVDPDRCSTGTGPS